MNTDNFPSRLDFFNRLNQAAREAEDSPPPPATPAEARALLSRVWGGGRQNLTRREALALQAACPGGETSLTQALEIAGRDGNPVPTT